MSEAMTKQKKSNEIHSKAAKAKTKIGLIAKNPEWADKEIRSTREELVRTKIELRKAKLVAGDHSSIHKVVTEDDGKRTWAALTSADVSGIRSNLPENSRSLVEWVAHMESIKAHMIRNNGSMIGFKYAGEALKLSLSFHQILGGTKYEAIKKAINDRVAWIETVQAARDVVTRASPPPNIKHFLRRRLLEDGYAQRLSEAKQEPKFRTTSRAITKKLLTIEHDDE